MVRLETIRESNSSNLLQSSEKLHHVPLCSIWYLLQASFQSAMIFRFQRPNQMIQFQTLVSFSLISSWIWPKLLHLVSATSFCWRPQSLFRLAQEFGNQYFCWMTWRFAIPFGHLINQTWNGIKSNPSFFLALASLWVCGFERLVPFYPITKVQTIWFKITTA